MPDKGLAIIEPMGARPVRATSPTLALLSERNSEFRTALGDGPGARAALDKRSRSPSRWRDRMRICTPAIQSHSSRCARRGNLCRRMDELANARKDFQGREEPSRTRLVQVDGSIQSQMELALTCRDLAHVERLDGQFALAETLYAQAGTRVESRTNSIPVERRTKPGSQTSSQNGDWRRFAGWLPKQLGSGAAAEDSGWQRRFSCCWRRAFRAGSHETDSSPSGAGRAFAAGTGCKKEIKT